MPSKPRAAPWTGLAAFLAGKSVAVGERRVRLRRRAGVTFLQLMTKRGKILSQPIVSEREAIVRFLELAKNAL